MKKLFLFIAMLAIGFSSCSSDDGNKRSELKVTIDGVQKTFNTIVVNKENGSYEGETWVEIGITATINNDPTEMIMFGVDEGELGGLAVWGFEYEKNGVDYDDDDDNVSSVVEINSNGMLKGTFAGTISGNDDEGNPVEVHFTDGSFKIFH